MNFSTTEVKILVANLLFFAIATSFFLIGSWAWRQSKPFSLPEPLPAWFKAWFLTVQLVGVLLPLIAMFLWGVWWGYSSVLTVLVSYFVMLGLQVVSEIVVLKQFHSPIWVTIPCLYLPYRIWQLYEGLIILNPTSELIWVRNILLVEIALWIFNYGVHLSQLPRLLRWETESRSN